MMSIEHRMLQITRAALHTAAVAGRFFAGQLFDGEIRTLIQCEYFKEVGQIRRANGFIKRDSQRAVGVTTEIDLARCRRLQNRFEWAVANVNTQRIEEIVMEHTIAETFEATVENFGRVMNSLRDFLEAFRAVINRIHA